MWHREYRGYAEALPRLKGNFAPGDHSRLSVLTSTNWGARERAVEAQVAMRSCPARGVESLRGRSLQMRQHNSPSWSRSQFNVDALGPQFQFAPVSLEPKASCTEKQRINVPQVRLATRIP